MTMYVARPLLICSLLLMTACTSMLPTFQNSSESAVGVAINTPLPADVSDILSQHRGYARVTSNETHWGPSVELNASPVYYSAMGQLCREVSVLKQTSGITEEAIACQQGQLWGIHRNVTRVLSQQPASFATSQ